MLNFCCFPSTLVTTLWESGSLSRSPSRERTVLPPHPLKPWRMTSKHNKISAPPSVNMSNNYSRRKSPNVVNLDGSGGAKRSPGLKIENGGIHKIEMGSHRLHKVL